MKRIGSNVWTGIYCAMERFVPQWGHWAAFEAYELGCYKTMREAKRRLLIFRWCGK